MRITVDSSHNFNKKELRGCDINLLPFIRVFPPQKFQGYGKNWTFHFGWLFWTVILHHFED